MQNIDIYQAGNYVQYTAGILNNGNPSTKIDRIVSINGKQIKTQRGLTISTNNQLQSLTLDESWLEALGFEKKYNKDTVSIWEITCGTPDGKPFTVIIFENNEKKEFYLAFVNEQIYAHSLQNLLYNITGRMIDLPIKL